MRAGALAILAVMALAPALFAGDGIDTAPLERKVKEADYIFIATAKSVTWMRNGKPVKGGGWRYDVASVELEISESISVPDAWKGRRKATILLTHHPLSNTGLIDALKGKPMIYLLHKESVSFTPAADGQDPGVPPEMKDKVLELLAKKQESAVYEQALFSLKRGASDEEIKRGLKVIDNGGAKAFPALLENINNVRPAATQFQREVMELDYGSGRERLHRPSIGDVAFEILQEKIEGNWPKEFRYLYVLERSDIQNWMKNHEGLDINELQKAAAREALQNVQKSNRGDAGQEFVTKHTADVLKGHAP